MIKYWIYILCSEHNGVLYIGVTNDLARRAYEHKEKLIEGFTKDYNVTMLVHAEEFQYINDAIRREKSLKKCNRQWKLHLIEEHNPEWRELYVDII